jgi:hypothetical protein
MVEVIMLTIVMLSVVYGKCSYAYHRYAECSLW